MKHENVLIVEDEKEIFELYKEYLEETDHFDKIIHAKDGIKGLELINSQKFKFIILDLNIPKISGIQILEKMKEKTSESRKRPNFNTPILIISGNIFSREAIKAAKLGVKNVLVKPCDQDKLLKQIDGIFF